MIRKKGSNKWSFGGSEQEKFKRMIRKYIDRHPKYANSIKSYSSNLALDEKLQKIEDSYENSLVEVIEDDDKKFTIIK